MLFRFRWNRNKDLQEIGQSGKAFKVARETKSEIISFKIITCQNNLKK